MSTKPSLPSLPPDHCRGCGAWLEESREVSGFCLHCYSGPVEELLAELRREAEEATVRGARDCYAIGEKLGQGGMGVVYLGRRVSDAALVAVKFIHRHLAQDAGLRARFVREGQALAVLDHAHIVRLLDSGEHGSEGEQAPFLVMEFVDGLDLRHELLIGSREGKTMPAAEVVAMGQALCEALAVAHAAGFLHRDLKPANILTGPDGVAKLADFGLVAQGNADLAASRVAGGAHYTAPELERTGRGDARADI